MSDLPTRGDVAEHIGHVSPDCKATQMAPTLAYVAGDLLTREEAANDPDLGSEWYRKGWDAGWDACLDGSDRQ